MSEASFLPEPEATPAVEAAYAEDLEDLGYVMNVSRLWGWDTRSWEAMFGVMSRATELGGLTFRQRAILVAATASTIEDSYCSMAWGGKLATKAGADVSAGVLRGDDQGLAAEEHVLAEWARKVARDPNATTAADVQGLRDSGLSNEQVFAVTLYVASRMAFSTINDALGAAPDAELAASLPAEVRDSVTYGRPAAPPR